VIKVPNRIKELREEMKMTQVRLSTELDVSQETVSAYEIGKHYPSVKSLMKMTELFHASMDYIMGLSNIRLPMKTDGLPRNEATLLSLYRSLDSVGKEKAISFIQGMLE